MGHGSAPRAQTFRTLLSGTFDCHPTAVRKLVRHSAIVKRYYLSGELYDWVTDPKALEKLFHSRRARVASRLIGRLGNSSVAVDVGCGTGLITRSIRAKMLIGIDINRWNLDHAKKRIRKADFVQCDSDHIPVRDSVSDLVVCTEILEHLTHPSDTLEEIARVMRADGTLIGSVPSRSPLWGLRNILSVTHPKSEPFHNNFLRSSLRQLVYSAFTDCDISFANFFMNLFFVARGPVRKTSGLVGKKESSKDKPAALQGLTVK